MSYIQKNLVNGEQILFETRLTGAIFILPIILIAAWGIGLIFVLWNWIVYTSSEFAVTNKRVVLKKGIIGYRIFEMNLDKVESIKIEQGLLGQIFNYGAIQVVGTGGSKERFTQIANPMKFRKAALEAMGSVLIKQADQANENNRNTQNNTNENMSVADELGKYATLLDKGHISREEFEAQKQKILNLNASAISSSTDERNTTRDLSSKEPMRSINILEENKKPELMGLPKGRWVAIGIVLLIFIIGSIIGFRSLSLEPTTESSPATTTTESNPVTTTTESNPVTTTTESSTASPQQSQQSQQSSAPATPTPPLTPGEQSYVATIESYQKTESQNVSSFLTLLNEPDSNNSLLTNQNWISSVFSYASALYTANDKVQNITSPSRRFDQVNTDFLSEFSDVNLGARYYITYVYPDNPNYMNPNYSEEGMTEIDSGDSCLVKLKSDLNALGIDTSSINSFEGATPIN